LLGVRAGHLSVARRDPLRGEASRDDCN